jgi:hypothetical protein
MFELAYVMLGDGSWSIARGVIEDFQWWCGDHEWVSPDSSHWHLFHDCWNVTYPSIAAARRFARAQGWEDREES